MTYSIIDFGAAAGGETLCTAAIQAAIDACAAAGGGRVVVPAGLYRTGTIFLRSHVELHLQHGARLKASTNLDDYNADDEYPQNSGCANEGWNAKHLILAIECEDVALTGTGTIDGSGETFFADEVKPLRFGMYAWRKGFLRERDTVNLRPGQMICFIECRGVTVRDLTLTASPCWCCFFHGCDDVQARGLRIFNPPYAANTDGLDIDTCRRVTVSDCIIDTGDDAIAIRGSARRLKDKNRCCEHIVITNCVLSSASSVFRIGVGTFPIRHVRVSNITIPYGGIGVNFCVEWGGVAGTPVEDVHFDGVSAGEVGLMTEVYVAHGTPVRHVTLSHFSGNVLSAVKLLCKTPGAVSDFALSDMDFKLHHDTLSCGDDLAETRGPSYMRCEGVERLRLTDCRVEAEPDVIAEWPDPVRIDENARLENCSFPQ